MVLEAWVDRIPVLVNGACGPTREHCEQSGGGLWFTSYPEFETVLDRLMADSELTPCSGTGAGTTWTGSSNGPCSSRATTSS